MDAIWELLKALLTLAFIGLLLFIIPVLFMDENLQR
jgi:hypothetical protein